MSDSRSSLRLFDLSMDARQLTRSAINAVRASLGVVGGVVAIKNVALTLVLLFLPLQSIAVLVIYGGISLVILGIVQIVRAFTFGREALKAL